MFAFFIAGYLVIYASYPFAPVWPPFRIQCRRQLNVWGCCWQVILWVYTVNLAFVFSRLLPSCGPLCKGARVPIGQHILRLPYCWRQRWQRDAAKEREGKKPILSSPALITFIGWFFLTRSSVCANNVKGAHTHAKSHYKSVKLVPAEGPHNVSCTRNLFAHWSAFYCVH